MPTGQDLSLNMSLRQRLSHRQLRFVRLLEMNPDELREAVETETEANPALEKDYLPEDKLPTVDRTDRDMETSVNDYGSHISESGLPNNYGSNYGSDDDFGYSFAPRDNNRSLADYLLAQLSQFTLSDNTLEAVRYLIGSMDSNGYIYRARTSLRQDLEFQEGVTVSDDEWAEAWRVVRQLDPAGVGATDLKDSLLLQLDRRPESSTVELARRILNEGYDLFIKMHFDRLASLLKASKERIDEAVDLIRSLDPKPGASKNDSVEDVTNIIIPDFMFEKDEAGRMQITLNNRLPHLRISQSFDEAVRSLATPAERKKNSYILGNWREARDFIELLEQRQMTLMRVMNAILKLQRAYFETEDIYSLRPMILKDVAAETGLDPSVISRATANKHIETPWGTFPLRFFFSDTIGEDGERDTEALTNRKIEQEIRTIIKDEDGRHPLSDEKIREAIMKRGYDISRRTVAKYRDRLGIPVARLRRK